MEKLDCNNMSDYRMDDQIIHLESKLRLGDTNRNKTKIVLPTYTRVSNGYLNSNVSSDNIDIESNLLQTPILNQSQKSLVEYKCLNRFETLYRDVQNVSNVIPEFERVGLGTRQFYKKKRYNKNNYDK